MIIKEGEICPLTHRHVMLRSDLGCLRCHHKVRLIGSGKELTVECSRRPKPGDGKKG
ncbi:MAG: hypothetical protein ABFE07_29305 [Armatimonadia bacterium]